MDIKQNIKRLFETTTNYKISNETDIAQTTLGRYTSGNSKIGNMKLDHAITLNNYYIKNKEMLSMQNLVNAIRKNYKVDGENERYVEVYNNASEILEEQDKEQFEEKFLSGYVQKTDDIEKLNYPIITFDYSGDADGKLFEANEDKEDILYEASEYFDKK